MDVFHHKVFICGETETYVQLCSGCSGVRTRPPRLLADPFPTMVPPPLISLIQKYLDFYLTLLVMSIWIVYLCCVRLFVVSYVLFAVATDRVDWNSTQWFQARLSLAMILSWEERVFGFVS